MLKDDFSEVSLNKNWEQLILGLDTTRTRGSTQVVSERDTWNAQTIF